MLRRTLAAVLVTMLLSIGGASAATLSGGSTGVSDGAGANEYDVVSTGVDVDGDGDVDGDALDHPREGALGVDPHADPVEVSLNDGEEPGEFGANPLRTDVDGDGLSDGKEILRYDTDPTSADTDGDGLEDGVEVSDDPAMSAADPAKFDVFVEIDYMEGERPSEEALDLLVEEYANAPVENPDGSTGIALHIVVDDAIPRESGTSFDERDRMMSEHMDYDGKGYRYGVVVVDARHGSKDVVGFSDIGGNNGAMVMERLDPPLHQANHLMHELGHSLGLGRNSYHGIDSRETGYSEYSSVMNYNSGREVLGYSGDEPFDDWTYIAENVYTPPTDEIE